jgi:hypothetical protein
MPADAARARYRAAGMCTNCGRQPPVTGLATCAVCREAMRRYREANRRPKRDRRNLGPNFTLRPIDYHHCERCHLRGHTQHECDLRRAK